MVVDDELEERAFQVYECVAFSGEESTSKSVVYFRFRFTLRVVEV